MRIVLVEDHDLYAKWLIGVLGEEFGGAVTWIATEQGFRNGRPEFERNVPDLFIVDVMLRWTDPSPNMQAPPEDARDCFLAGMRCVALLRSSAHTAAVPIVLLSALDEDDLERALESVGPSPGVHIVQKAKDENVVAGIRAALAG